MFYGNNSGPTPSKKIKFSPNISTNGSNKRTISFGNINGAGNSSSASSSSSSSSSSVVAGPSGANNNGAGSNGGAKPKGNIQQHRDQLPIFQNKDNLVELIRKNKTLIIISEPGTGKTTQIPQYISGVRLHEDKKVGITQPRRVAAISVAMRVAQEYGNGMTVGDYVGYTVRFEDVTSKKTKIKYITDGMLLREALSDRLLMDYSIIMLDEAHERTIHTDVLFGIVKKAQKVREDKKMAALKIIITSATMDVDHFSNYFNGCPVIYLEGRLHPIEMNYLVEPEEDYERVCVSTFFQIHKDAPPEEGVLIFLTGQEEIETCANRIRLMARDPEVQGPPVKVCTLYAAQPGNQQMAVFAPAPKGTRKVVISTNVAETSITISGIKYVIDSGMVKERSYNSVTGLEALKVSRISREQADQRAGRAGRETPGVCYRMYTRAEFEQRMLKSSVPEILKVNLSGIALQLLALGIHIKKFDFLNSPTKEAIETAFEELKLLGAVDSITSFNLTPLGKKMAKFPLDPKLSKVLILSDRYGCVKEALIVVALLSSESILLNPVSKREEALDARQKFRSGYGDHLTLLNIYTAFENIGKDNLKSWCQDHFINTRNLLYVREVKNQLKEICKKCDIKGSTCCSDMDPLRKCLLAGLCTNVAELQKDRKYITLDKRHTTYIHPSSVLHGLLPAYVIFTEVVQTSKCYLRDLTAVEGDWLNEVAPDYFKSRHLNSNGRSS